MNSLGLSKALSLKGFGLDVVRYIPCPKESGMDRIEIPSGGGV
jgi:hypothetical protein